MDYEEKKIVKPSWQFSTMLFIFMVLIVMKTIGVVDNAYDYWEDALYPIYLPLLLFSVVIDILAYCYAFLGIYKALQRKPYSISMLRLSVFYFLIQFCFNSMGKIGSVLPIHPYLFFPIILFLIIFLVYLFKSKSLREYIPKAERKFGIMGWFGILIYVLVASMYVWKISDDYQKNRNSMPLKSTEVALKKGEVTDGLIAYHPLDGWIADTIIGNEKDGYLRVYHTDSCHDILITSMNLDYQSRIDYYQILSECCMSQIPDTIGLIEVANESKFYNGGSYYLNTYAVGTSDSLTAYWTFSALIDSASHKAAALSNFQVSSYEKSHKMSEEFMKTVRFNLK